MKYIVKTDDGKETRTPIGSFDDFGRASDYADRETFLTQQNTVVVDDRSNIVYEGRSNVNWMQR